MKKMLGIFGALMLVLGMAGLSHAAFMDYGDIMRVVYDVSGTVTSPAIGHVEAITDLGSAGTLLDGASHTVGNGVDAFTNFTYSGATNDQLRVGYFVWDGPTASPKTAYIAGQSQLMETASNSNGFGSAYGTTQGFYTNSSNQIAVSSTGNTIKVAQGTADGSYSATFNAGALKIGSMGSFLASLTGDASLSGLSDSNPIVMSLYGWTSFGFNKNGTLVSNEQIETLANGSTIIGPQTSPVPIPAAVWLLGSGLLGLIGIRRRVS